MISEGSLGTETWSNDAEKSALHDRSAFTFCILNDIQLENSHFKL